MQSELLIPSDQLGKSHKFTFYCIFPPNPKLSLLSIALSAIPSRKALLILTCEALILANLELFQNQGTDYPIMYTTNAN